MNVVINNINIRTFIRIHVMINRDSLMNSFLSLYILYADFFLLLLFTYTAFLIVCVCVCVWTFFFCIYIKCTSRKICLHFRWEMLTYFWFNRVMNFLRKIINLNQINNGNYLDKYPTSLVFLSRSNLRLLNVMFKKLVSQHYWTLCQIKVSK